MITSADNSRIQVEGVVLVELVNRGKSALEMVYVCRGSKGVPAVPQGLHCPGGGPGEVPRGSGEGDQ